MQLDEATEMVEKYLVPGLYLDKQTPDLSNNADVFNVLCTRRLILEKVRAELVSRNLCPVTIHTLCSIFAMSYCSVVMAPANRLRDTTDV